jgi:hypothetical protein
MNLDPRTVFKKAAGRAAAATGNVASGAGALAVSAALWNPLPIVLWGLGSAAWVLYAATSPKYTRRVLDEERRAAELQAEQERQALVVKIEAVLARRPFDAWVRAGVLPDYLKGFARLVAVRDRVAELVAERHDDFLAALGIQKQLSYLLGAYLQFVQGRLTVLQVLADFRPCTDSDAAAEAADAPQARGRGGQPSPPGTAMPRENAAAAWRSGHGHRHQRADGSPRTLFAQAAGHPALAEAAPGASPAELARAAPHTEAGRAACPVDLPHVAALVADLDLRIAALRELCTREPATLKTREWHIDVLQGQQELLRDCAGRDQQLVAQLTAIPDAFDVIAGRISAAQFDAAGLAAYTGGVVEQIEETEKLLRDSSDTARPAVNAAGGLSSGQPAADGGSAGASPPGPRTPPPATGP